MREIDYPIVRNKTTKLLFVVYVPDLDNPDTPLLLDLDDVVLRFMAKDRIQDTDDDAIIDLTSEVSGGIVKRDQLTFRGQAIATIPGSSTAGLPPDTTTFLHYEFEIEEPGSSPEVTQRGRLSVEPAVRRGA